jgi:hypothetical protein
MWFKTFTVCDTLKVAVAVWSEFIVTVHVLFVPLQAPPHPAKNAPFPAVAVSLTWVPEANAAVHVGAQVIPVGLLTTVPVALPISCAVN